MKKKVHTNTFYKYLISYVICLILPVLILSFTFYNYFITKYSNQLIRKYTQNIDSTFNLIDSKIGSINSISKQLLLSTELSNMFISENSNVGSYFSIDRLIKSYLNTNDNINDIWYYNKNYDVFYHNGQMISKESFIKYGPKYSLINTDELLNKLYNNKKPDWIGMDTVTIYNNKYDLISYIISFPNSYISEDSVLLFQLNIEMIYSILKTNIQWNNFLTALVSDNTIIYSSDQSQNELIKKIMNLDLESDTISGVQELSNKKYFVNIYKSLNSDLTYISMLPYNELTSETRKFVELLMIIILICIFVGSILIYLLMIYNYKPINNLLYYIKTQINPSIKQDNEIEQIKIAIKSLEDKNINLKTYNDKYRNEHIIYNILKGNYKSENELNSAIIKNNLFYYNSYYRVLILKINNFDNLLDIDLETNFKNIASNFFSESNFYFVDFIDINSYIIIMSSNCEYHNFKLNIDELRNKLEALLNLDIIISIGNLYNNPLYIQESYSQAKIALHSKININNNKISIYSDIDNKFQNSFINLTQELNTLHDTIVEKNTVKLDFLISELINYILNINNVNYFYKLCICYDIINTLLKSVYDINALNTDLLNKCIFKFYNKESNNINELIELIQNYTKNLIIFINNDKNYIEDNFSAILKFIENNYTESDFGVQKICDNFNISISNLSHLFKSKTGENISEFINKLKMKYAKHLLLSTNLSINEISDKLGYFQASSFIRKFKNVEGITPGEFRNKSN